MEAQRPSPEPDQHPESDQHNQVGIADIEPVPGTYSKVTASNEPGGITLIRR
jgi:hypothetical protein